MTGTFEGVGSLQFTPDNKQCYAYSGIMSIDQNETTMIEFDVNSEYIVSNIQFNSNLSLGDDMYRFKVYLNDICVQAHLTGRHEYDQKYENFLQIVVPPFTTVKLTAQNINDTNDRDQIVSFIGSVHGAIEQENLESITNNNKWASL